MRCDAKLIVPLAGLAAMAACAPVDPGFSEAMRYDMAAQTIDPDPVYPADGAKPGDSGAKGAAAVKAYRAGQTKALRIERSDSAGGGSGSSSGN